MKFWTEKRNLGLLSVIVSSFKLVNVPWHFLMLDVFAMSEKMYLFFECSALEKAAVKEQVEVSFMSNYLK